MVVTSTDRPTHSCLTAGWAEGEHSWLFHRVRCTNNLYVWFESIAVHKHQNMKLSIIILALVLICFTGCAQKKKQFTWPKPLRDSTWYSSQCDTTFGTIEASADGGKIVGPGYVTCCLVYTWHQNIYSEKDQHLIDSVQNARGIFFLGWSGMAVGPCRSKAYIKTSTGYKRVEQPFILKP